MKVDHTELDRVNVVSQKLYDEKQWKVQVYMCYNAGT